MSDESDDQTI